MNKEYVLEQLSTNNFYDQYFEFHDIEENDIKIKPEMCMHRTSPLVLSCFL